MHKLTLYFAPGACSRVSLIALEATGVVFDTELMVFAKGGHKSPEFRQLNPSSKIPVLLVDGVAISQNVAILTWLDTAYPDAKLLPKSKTALERAQRIALLSRFSSDLHPLVSRIRVPHFFCDAANSTGRVVEMAASAMRTQLLPIEETLSTQTWMCGEQLSVIDAYLHWVWFRITDAGFDQSDFPHISAHYTKTLAIPEVKRALLKEQTAEVFLTENGLNPQFLKTKHINGGT